MVSEEREDVKWEARRCFVGQGRCLACVAHKQQGMVSEGGCISRRFAHTRGVGLIFESDQILGESLGSCWTGVFFS